MLKISKIIILLGLFSISTFQLTAQGATQQPATQQPVTQQNLDSEGEKALNSFAESFPDLMSYLASPSGENAWNSFYKNPMEGLTKENISVFSWLFSNDVNPLYTVLIGVSENVQNNFFSELSQNIKNNKVAPQQFLDRLFAYSIEPTAFKPTPPNPSLDAIKPTNFTNSAELVGFLAKYVDYNKSQNSQFSLASNEMSSTGWNAMGLAILNTLSDPNNGLGLSSEDINNLTNISKTYLSVLNEEMINNSPDLSPAYKSQVYDVISKIFLPSNSDSPDVINLQNQLASDKSSFDDIMTILSTFSSQSTIENNPSPTIMPSNETVIKNPTITAPADNQGKSDAVRSEQGKTLLSTPQIKS
jgi:hypothetical protein